MWNPNLRINTLCILIKSSRGDNQVHDFYLFTYLCIFLVTFNCIEVSLNCISTILQESLLQTTGTFQFYYWLTNVSRVLFQNKFQQAYTHCQHPEALKANATVWGKEFLCTVLYLTGPFFIPPTDPSHIATYKSTGKILWRFAVLGIVVRIFPENHVCQRGQDLGLYLPFLWSSAVLH